MKETLFSKILQYALYAAFIAGVTGVVTLPIMRGFYSDVIHEVFSVGVAYRAFIMPFIAVMAIPCLWIVLEMILMLRSVPKDPFVMRNVHALYRIGIIFFVLALAFMVKCLIFLLPSAVLLMVLTLACIFLFVMFGLFAFTLAALIRQAVVFREENDLTI